MKRYKNAEIEVTKFEGHGYCDICHGPVQDDNYVAGFRVEKGEYEHGVGFFAHPKCALYVGQMIVRACAKYAALSKTKARVRKARRRSDVCEKARR